MQKQIVEAYPDQPLKIFMVWMPMVPGDSERSARKIAAQFTDKRVVHFYDSERRIGRAYRDGAFKNCIQDALAVMPQNHHMYETLKEWSSYPNKTRPLWDAVLFYEPGREWGGGSPVPCRWSKQVGFWGDESGSEITGEFWRNDCTSLPIESDWHIEIKQAMYNVMPHS